MWPDFHDRLAEQISAVLNATLPAPFYAQLRQREEIGIAGEAFRSIIPDVSVHRESGSPGRAATTVTGFRTTVSESIEIVADDLPVVNFVEIVDADSHDEVVTLIEILSPSNKSSGADREHYLAKRGDILQSDASLVEIDLLREGDRSFYGLAAWDRIRRLDPPAEYLVFLARSWRPRGGGSGQLFPARITAPLPVIAVPLRESIDELPLDLQECFSLTYDRGPYRRRIDYSQPPRIRLPDRLHAWAEDCLRDAGLHSQ